MYYNTYICKLCNFKTISTRSIRVHFESKKHISHQKPYDAAILLKQQKVDHLNNLVDLIEEEIDD